MNCQEIFKYLYIYANRTISRTNKDFVEMHIKKCKSCFNIADALSKLIPQMNNTAVKEDSMHFIIDFPDVNLCYCGYRFEIPDFEKLNKLLYKNNNKLLEDGYYIETKYSNSCNLIGMFDNEGNEIKFSQEETDDNFILVKTTSFNKFYNYMWIYYSFIHNKSKFAITKVKDKRNLYCGNMNHLCGGELKSALYQAIPINSENIRIKQGNGILCAGCFKFPYAERYVAENEPIDLNYYFTLNNEY